MVLTQTTRSYATGFRAADKGKSVQGWHFIGADLRLSFSTETLELGKIYQAPRGAQLRDHGMHASRQILEALKNARGPIACLVELVGEIEEEQSRLYGRRWQVLAYGDATWQLHEFALELAEQLAAAHPRLLRWLQVKKQWIDRSASSGTLARTRREAQAFAASQPSLEARMVAVALEEDRIWQHLCQIAWEVAEYLRRTSGASETSSGQGVWHKLNQRLEKRIRPKLRCYEGTRGYTDADFDYSDLRKLVLTGTEAVARKNSASAKAKRLLLVEHEADLADGLQDFLGDFEVTVVSGAEKALREIAQAEYTAILCDLDVPGFHFDGFYQKLDKLRPQLGSRTIVMGSSLVEGGLWLDRDLPVLAKPVQVSQLLDALDAFDQASAEKTVLTRSVLLLEDDSDLARQVTEGLENSYFAVSAAANGAEAIQLALREEFSLVICDLDVRGLVLPAFCRTLERFKPKLCQHLVVLAPENYSPDACLLQRGVKVVNKPLELGQLVKALE